MKTHLFGAGDPEAAKRRRALQEKIQIKRELEAKLARLDQQDAEDQA